jgi:hypothetical protein
MPVMKVRLAGPATNLPRGARGRRLASGGANRRTGLNSLEVTIAGFANNFTTKQVCIAVNSSGTTTAQEASPLLLCAAFHKILPLWADDLLIDCLFEAVKVSLCHAKLHLISLLLASHSL